MAIHLRILTLLDQTTALQLASYSSTLILKSARRLALILDRLPAKTGTFSEPYRPSGSSLKMGTFPQLSAPLLLGYDRTDNPALVYCKSHSSSPRHLNNLYHLLTAHQTSSKTSSATPSAPTGTAPLRRVSAALAPSAEPMIPTAILVQVAPRSMPALVRLTSLSRFVLLRHRGRLNLRLRRSLLRCRFIMRVFEMVG